MRSFSLQECVCEHTCSNDASQWGILPTICTLDVKTLPGSGVGFFSAEQDEHNRHRCLLPFSKTGILEASKYSTGNYSVNCETLHVVTLFSADLRKSLFHISKLFCFFRRNLSLVTIKREATLSSAWFWIGLFRHLTRCLRQKSYCLDHLHLSQGSYMRLCDASSEKLCLL